MNSKCSFFEWTIPLKINCIFHHKLQHLLVVVDVTDYDWQQAEHQDDGCGVDNRVKRFEAVRVIPSPVQILLDKSISADDICKCISTANNWDFFSCSRKVGVEDVWKDLITNRSRVKGSRYTSTMKENQKKIAQQINPALKKLLK